MNGFVVVDVGMCPILFLNRWVVDVQLLGHYPNLVLLVVANLDVDVIANVANGDVRPDGYVHVVGVFAIVDHDVDRFATLDLVDVPSVVYLLLRILLLSILPLYLMLLLFLLSLLL